MLQRLKGKLDGKTPDGITLFTVWLKIHLNHACQAEGVEMMDHGRQTQTQPAGEL